MPGARAQRGERRSAGHRTRVWCLDDRLHGRVFGLPALSSLIRVLPRLPIHSGWWYFIVMVPIVGVFILLIFLAYVPARPVAIAFGTHPLGAKGKTPMRLPRGMKPSPSEAERSRRKSLNTIAKNIAHQGPTQLGTLDVVDFTVNAVISVIVRNFQDYEDARLTPPPCKTFILQLGREWVAKWWHQSLRSRKSTRCWHLSPGPPGTADEICETLPLGALQRLHGVERVAGAGALCSQPRARGSAAILSPPFRDLV